MQTKFVSLSAESVRLCDRKGYVSHLIVELAMNAAAQNVNNADKAAAKGDRSLSATPATTRAPRERSSIAFPYISLDDAEEGTRAVFGRAGTAEIVVAQAAHAMNQSPTSSNFRSYIASMKLFGLAETEQGRVRVTELGRAISENVSVAAARVEAFLRIPLYERVKANHHGRTLPKTPAFEHELTQAGVAPKQATRARQVFERSARHAGFLAQGSDRFVEPILEHNRQRLATGTPPIRDNSANTDIHKHGERGGGSWSEDDPGNDAERHLFIGGLLSALPEPGTSWPVQARIKWLRAASSIFDLMYEGDAFIKVDEDRSP